MEVIYFIGGLIIGSLSIYLALNRKLNSYKIQKIESEHLISVEQKRFEFLDSQSKNLAAELNLERERSEKLSNSLSISQTEAQHLREKIDRQTNDFENIQKKFSDQFNNLAQAIFEEKSKKFTLQNKEQISQILDPLHEKLKGFEQKVEDTYLKNIKDRSELQAEIKKLYDLNARISQEANNLTKALKGDVKKQGNWGELILENILENSGLRKDVEFKTQVSLRSISGEKYMPDVIIYLPENKHIIIDSKVSLLAYEQFANTENNEEQKLYLNEHLLSLKKHIKQLSDKIYYKLEGINSPEYVLLFVPIESSFSAAVKEDSALFNFAWDHKIVIVSPSTLIATLLTVASIWRQENQTRNALEIAKKSGDLYDKFVGLTESMLELGQKLEQTQKAYHSSINKLSEGKGNLIKRAEDIRILGAKTSKSFSNKLLDQTDNH